MSVCHGCVKSLPRAVPGEVALCRVCSQASKCVFCGTNELKEGGTFLCTDIVCINMVHASCWAEKGGGGEGASQEWPGMCPPCHDREIERCKGSL